VSQPVEMWKNPLHSRAPSASVRIIDSTNVVTDDLFD
jgi:hypothetical protein